MPSSESSVGDKKMQASANEPFTKSTYFIIIIVAVAVTLVVLVFMVTICVVHKKRTGEMDLGKGIEIV
jgi:heme/copper-type cytochrome/quinol oxidase subunit 2